MRGALIAVIVWSMLVAWTARNARSLGANIALWSLFATLVGAGAFAVGSALMWILLDREGAGALSVLGILLPVGFMTGSMVAINVLMQRGTLGAKQRARWQVHILKHGDGTMHIDNGRVILEWPEGSREVDISRLQNVQADGECVRMHHSDEEIVVMPVGESLSPEGRKRLSAQITQRLRVALPVAVARV